MECYKVITWIFAMVLLGVGSYSEFPHQYEAKNVTRSRRLEIKKPEFFPNIIQKSRKEFIFTYVADKHDKPQRNNVDDSNEGTPVNKINQRIKRAFNTDIFTFPHNTFLTPITRFENHHRKKW